MGGGWSGCEAMEWLRGWSGCEAMVVEWLRGDGVVERRVCGRVRG